MSKASAPHACASQRQAGWHYQHSDVVKHRLNDLELEASVLRDVYIAAH
jgi:hypothetical protein